VATGTERYLTFGTYIAQDSANKKKLTGTQTVTIVLDDFQLIPDDQTEGECPAFAVNKTSIYKYNYRHKEMDYSLYGKGELAIPYDKTDSNFLTREKQIPPPGDVFFDFNKATLKSDAAKMLATFFLGKTDLATVDSIYVEGHTDSIGTDKRNMALSLQRCESIRQWLLLNSVVANAGIQVHPFGKTRPIATNSTPQGRALNRRVELIVFRKKGE
jgi:outer membrane protein OmpA-like peptidoglycan-associated protein